MKNECTTPLKIYTDGSCKKLGTQNCCGWAFIAFRDEHKVYQKSGSTRNSTNQRMEMKAVLEGLRYAKLNREENERVIVYSDSAYVINCYKEGWYKNWERNGWRNSKKDPVENRDLWEQIIPFFKSFWYTFLKVQGHSDDERNNECDRIAQYEADCLKYDRKGIYGND